MNSYHRLYSRNMRKILILLTILLPVLLVVAALLWSLGFFTRAQPVNLVEVSMAPLQRSLTTNGKIEAEKVRELRSPAAGFCRRTTVRDGVLLKAGQEILRIEDPSLPSQMAAAQAELEAARLDLRDVERGPSADDLGQAEAEVGRARLAAANARKILETNEWLLARQAIARHEVEQSRHNLAEAEQAVSAAQEHVAGLKKRFGEADLARARARLDAAQVRLQFLRDGEGRLVLRAPADGTLYQYEVKDGAFLNAGELVGLFADLTHLRLRAYVDEPDIGQVAIGEKVIIRWDARPNEEWTGSVMHLPVQVVALGTRSVADVLCSLENPKSTLLTNVNVDVEIQVPQGPDAVSLPRGVVFPEGKREFVWRIKQGKAEKSYVETGRGTSSRIEIKKGLVVGDTVIDPGDTILTEGLNVQAVKK
jgi:HlyD family secretion protein